MIDIDSFISRQLAQWPLAASNFAALDNVVTREVEGAGGYKVQFNPARIVSTGANVSKEAIKARKCFLCEANRPAEQFGLDFGDYTILINPFPIFPGHLTIPAKEHTPQRISGRAGDMMRLADSLPGYTIFYNGAKCGASAPDHIHFQGVPSRCLPLWDTVKYAGLTTVIGGQKAYVINYSDIAVAEKELEAYLTTLPADAESGEPMINVLCKAGTLVVIPRRRHRPSDYGSEDGQILLSPASIDLAGVLITPLRRDFDNVDAATVKRVLSEVSFTDREEQQIVNVGIMSAKKLEFYLHGEYRSGDDIVSGAVSLTARGFGAPLEFVPVGDDCFVEVKDVTIGVNFHWERKEVQRFRGSVRVVKDGDELVFINSLGVEDYLISVISSEMSATSSLELLKAHAVISRSWVLAQIDKDGTDKSDKSDRSDRPGEHIVWYDHDDHTLFDICADDHCQRYQGITRASTTEVVEAVEATRGQVLVSDGELCDARFSKCCGGVMEVFESCWADTPMPYLVARADTSTPLVYPDLTKEEEACKWIMSAPEAFCNTSDTRVLRQVLNNYDQETADFYRWTVSYTTDELTELISRKSGIDFGRILDLVPLRRGTSGRIVILRIVGENTTVDVGKELEIRRWLSESHLYSSAFVVEKTPGGFTLHGAGWGHGVGLCQIGAAMMADKGYGYRKILAHYYPGSTIAENYNRK